MIGGALSAEDSTLMAIKLGAKRMRMYGIPKNGLPG